LLEAFDEPNGSLYHNVSQLVNGIPEAFAVTLVLDPTPCITVPAGG